MTEQVYSASRNGVSTNDTQNNKLSFFSIFGAIISLNLILSAGYWAYNLKLIKNDIFKNLDDGFCFDIDCETC